MRLDLAQDAMRFLGQLLAHVVVGEMHVQVAQVLSGTGGVGPFLR
ncbi:MAG: hypothetical protein QMB08_09240 [Acidimicrobiales bacterium]